MTTRARKKAVIDRLKAKASAATGVFEGAVPKDHGRQWYLVVFTNSGLRVRPRFTGPSSGVTQSFTIHSVGTTPEQAQLGAEVVQDQLVDFLPVVAGWNCHRLTHEVSLPVQVDRDITPPLYYCVDEFDLVAERI